MYVDARLGSDNGTRGFEQHGRHAHRGNTGDAPGWHAASHTAWFNAKSNAARYYRNSGQSAAGYARWRTTCNAGTRLGHPSNAESAGYTR